MPFVCNQCPRRCGVVRGDEKPGQGKGYCRMGEKPALARMALHFDEEPCISGTRGSGAVFFSDVRLNASIARTTRSAAAVSGARCRYNPCARAFSA